jgi:hypothetical protein
MKKWQAKNSKEMTMARQGQIHVVPNPKGGWDIKRDGADRVSAHTPRKPEAEARGREIAIKEELELVIHNEDGSIAEKNSFGNDPSPPKG